MPDLPRRHKPPRVKAHRFHAHEPQKPTTGTPRLRGRRRKERNSRLKDQNPLCVECLARGRVRPAVEFDHIIPLHKGGPEHESNLRGLCRECHQAKTNADRRGKREIGVDGWPVGGDS